MRGYVQEIGTIDKDGSSETPKVSICIKSYGCKRLGLLCYSLTTLQQNRNPMKRYISEY